MVKNWITAKLRQSTNYKLKQWDGQLNHFDFVRIASVYYNNKKMKWLIYLRCSCFRVIIHLSTTVSNVN